MENGVGDQLTAYEAGCGVRFDGLTTAGQKLLPTIIAIQDDPRMGQLYKIWIT